MNKTILSLAIAIIPFQFSFAARDSKSCATSLVGPKTNASSKARTSQSTAPNWALMSSVEKNKLAEDPHGGILKQWVVDSQWGRRYDVGEYLFFYMPRHPLKGFYVQIVAIKVFPKEQGTMHSVPFALQLVDMQNSSSKAQWFTSLPDLRKRILSYNGISNGKYWGNLDTDLIYGVRVGRHFSVVDIMEGGLFAIDEGNGFYILEYDQFRIR